MKGLKTESSQKYLKALILARGPKELSRVIFEESERVKSTGEAFKFHFPQAHFVHIQ